MFLNFLKGHIMNNAYKFLLASLLSFSGVAVCMEGQDNPNESTSPIQPDQLTIAGRTFMTPRESEDNLRRIFALSATLNPQASQEGLAAVDAEQNRRNTEAVALFNYFAPEPLDDLDVVPIQLVTPGQLEEIGRERRRATVRAAQAILSPVTRTVVPVAGNANVINLTRVTLSRRTYPGGRVTTVVRRHRRTSTQADATVNVIQQRVLDTHPDFNPEFN